MRERVLALSLIALAACATPDDARLTALSDNQLQRLCDEYPERSVSCDGDDGVSFSYGGDCDTILVSDVPEGCQATAGDWRGCFDTLFEETDESLCDNATPEGCAVLLSADCFDL